ncbi:MAG: coenzyme F420-0:L-glutamate ligase [Patescibacteria group bacterium]
MLNVQPIKTRILQPPKDDLFEVIWNELKELPERSVLAITSKVVSIHEGRCVAIDQVPDKNKLIKQEAERYSNEIHPLSDSIMLTIKHGLITPFAGIDESNGNGHYILFPENPQASAQTIWNWVNQTYGTKEFGVVITDSAMVPLRRGTIGIALGTWGFLPVKDYRGKPDLFDRPAKFSWLSVADTLASAAVLAMGEGNERTPLALITGDLPITFTDSNPEEHPDYLSPKIPPDEDMFSPIMKW